MPELIDYVLLEIDEHLGGLDDSDDAPFGELARTERDGDRLIVRHETRDDVAVEITVRTLDA